MADGGAISADMYADHIRPHDARLLKKIGTGSIHFCGDGQHLIEPMLKIPGLRGLDFGQPHLMDVSAIYRMCCAHRVALTSIKPPREDLVSGKARAECPTGVVFVYQTEDFDDASQVVQAYKGL